ncbi:MAG TPA: hypothetical protein VIY66_11665 [Candidatus Acidoferrales bacterium]
MQAAKAPVFVPDGHNMLYPAHMLGYLRAICLAQTGAPHVECGSSLPLSAAGACPGVLLASTWELQSPDWRVWFHVAHPAFTG